jgi:hypothetical protein
MCLSFVFFGKEPEPLVSAGVQGWCLRRISRIGAGAAALESIHQI